MNLVCSIDDNYVQHCCAMLTSFFTNNHSEEHVVHLLTEGLTEKNKDIIRCLVTSYHGEFFYYVVDSQMLAACPIREEDHLTIATYYRLLMADILPQQLDKILYLDCDIIINDSIKEFWDTPLDGYALAAIEELGCSLPDVYERLGYNRRYGYFNAGVLLVNLDYWRKCHLTQCFLEYVSHNFSRLKSHDQDVLNALLHDKCLHVSYEWNVEEAFYHYSVMKRLKHDKVLKSILCHPKILHYTWKPKPWEVHCKHPFRIKYYIYISKMSGADKKLFSLGWKIHACWDKYVFCLLLKLGITGHRFYRL